MSDQPWTPGPWEWEDDDTRDYLFGNAPGGFKAVLAYLNSDCIAPMQADRELIALAPEMAETILAFCDARGTDQWFLPVVDKIRAIGGEHG